jgi:hypothetical protein
MLMVNQQLSVGHSQIDAHLEEPSLVMMGVRRLDHNPAAHDLVIELFELGGLLTKGCLHGIRAFHIPEGDL